MEKLSLALVTSARKLRPYFQNHHIRVPNSYPLRQVLQNPELSGRIVKWAIELGEVDIEYVPRTVIKAQALADFVAEFIKQPGPELRVVEKTTTTASTPEGPSTPNTDLSRWKLFVDRLSSSGGSGAGLVMVSPDHYKTSYALRYDFKASNNEMEYEALNSQS